MTYDSSTIFEGLLPAQSPQAASQVVDNSYRWAEVISTGPLVIQFDGDTAPLAVTPDSLVLPSPGDRVWCQLYGRRVIVLGVGQ